MAKIAGRLAWLVFAAAVVLAAPQAQADTLTFTAVKDNSVFESGAGTNTGSNSNGAGPNLFAGGTSSFGLRRALIQFAVGTLPAGSTINSATVTLVINQASPNGGTPDFSLHRLTSDWGEGTSDSGPVGGQGAAPTAGDANWDNAFDPATPWGAPGGDFDGLASATATVAGAGTYTWTSAALANDVQFWLDNPGLNFGWMVKADDEAGWNARRFSSRENTGLDVQPSLTIDYTPPSGGGTVPTVSQWGLILMTLLLLTGATLVFGRVRSVAGSERGTRLLVSDRSVLVPALYTKVLGAVLGLVLVGFAATRLLLGEVSAVDVTGSLLAAPVFAYLVHLWVSRR